MDLKTILKDKLQLLLIKNNFRIGRTTDFNLVEQFFTSIKPMTTNHELIRIGGDLDGGYLIPDDLENIGCCFSPGVSSVATFEMALAEKGMQCYLADYSVDAPPIENKLFKFEKKFLGGRNDDIYMTLDSWVETAPCGCDLMLQMDIEGSEYEVIFDASCDTLRKFRIMVIEFHGLTNLCDRQGFELISLTFGKLIKDFVVVHIHPNNCAKPMKYGKYQIPPVAEFTFLRKDRVSSKYPTVKFPHALDRKCVIENEDVALPGCWYQ